MFALCGSATAAFYINCAGCHTVPQSGMAIVNFQTTTNLGNGLRKVFKVSPGQTAVIQLSVTNNYGGNYALNINNLDAGGVNNSSDHLAYTADPAWTHYFPGTTTNFFMAGCATTSPDLWTFNLVVKTNTPADFYTINSQMAGYYSSTMWSQQESFYVQVVDCRAAGAGAPGATAVRQFVLRAGRHHQRLHLLLGVHDQPDRAHVECRRPNPGQRHDQDPDGYHGDRLVAFLPCACAVSQRGRQPVLGRWPSGTSSLDSQHGATSDPRKRRRRVRAFPTHRLSLAQRPDQL